MADRKIVLTMTPQEADALSRLIGFLCRDDAKQVDHILGRNPHAGPSQSTIAIGRINAALNGDQQ